MSPWDHEQYGKGEGELYVQFIVDIVKPYMDSLYRTKDDPANTALLGASLGGFITHYAICAHPEVFGKAGIFSPSYWYSDAVFTYTSQRPPANSARLFMVVGEKEEEGMVEGASRMYSHLQELGHPEGSMQLIVDPEGEHNEAFWKGHFLEAVCWLFEVGK